MVISYLGACKRATLKMCVSKVSSWPRVCKRQEALAVGQGMFQNGTSFKVQ